jgi:hypothetical protein
MATNGLTAHPAESEYNERKLTSFKGNKVSETAFGKHPILFIEFATNRLCPRIFVKREECGRI